MKFWILPNRHSDLTKITNSNEITALNLSHSENACWREKNSSFFLIQKAFSRLYKAT